MPCPALPRPAPQVPEVCDWLELIGLGQYRRRFVHNAVGGALLLRLSGEELKVGARVFSVQCSGVEKCCGMAGAVSAWLQALLIRPAAEVRVAQLPAFAADT